MDIDLQTIQAATNNALISLLTSVTLFLPRLFNALILLSAANLASRLA